MLSAWNVRTTNRRRRRFCWGSVVLRVAERLYLVII